MVYLLYGEDGFSIKEALDGIKVSLGDTEMVGLNTTTLEGESLTFNEVKAVCDTVPFLAPVRLVVVSNLLSRFEPRGRGGRGKALEVTDAWTPLAGYVKTEMPETTVLVLVDGPLRVGNKLFQQIKPNVEVRQFPPVRGAALESWIRERVSKHGGRISGPAVKLLAQLVGDDLWTMASEIDKLVLYCQGQEVQERDVHQVTTQARETSIFSLVDAVAESRTADAMRLLEELLEDGSAPPYLLFMITRQYRLIIQAQEVQKQAKELRGIGQLLGVTNEYALGKVLAQARRYTREHLNRIYQRLLDADASIKRGWLPPDVALELLVPDLCATTRARRG